VRALRRIEAGTYTEPAQRRPARDADGRYAAACGDLDDFGRCGARYHAADCSAVAEGALSRGTPEQARAWNNALGRNSGGADTAAALGLASPSGEPGDGTDAWDGLLHSDGPDPLLRERVLAYLGEPGGVPYERPPEREPRPDVSGVRAALGL
jgi:hypothetical protein